MSRFLIASGAALALVLGSTAALAQENAPELARGLDAAKLTLEKAVTTAETASKGHALAAQTWMDGPNIAVKVLCISGETVFMVPIDHTGKAGEAKPATPEQEKAAKIVDAAGIHKAMTDNKIPLTKAIRAAEKESKGTATFSYASVRNGALNFHVVTVADGKAVHVTVNGKTGKATIGEKEPS